MKKIVAVTSGGPGAGKTTIALNLAITLNRGGDRTALLDTDLGLSNVATLLGSQPELTLYDLLFQGRKLEDIVVNGPLDVSIIPGGTGLKELSAISAEEYGYLADQLSTIENYDYLIVDTSDGFSPGNSPFLMAADSVVVVVTSERSSIESGINLFQSLAENGYSGELLLAPNKFSSADSVISCVREFESLSRKSPSLDISSLPPILKDKVITNAMIKQKPFMLTARNSAVGKGFQKFADTLVEGAGGVVKPSDYIMAIAKIVTGSKNEVPEEISLAPELERLKPEITIESREELIPTLDELPVLRVATGSEKIRLEVEEPDSCIETNEREIPTTVGLSSNPELSSAIIKSQNAMIKAFEKNSAIQQKTIETLERLIQIVTSQGLASAQGTLAPPADAPPLLRSSKKPPPPLESKDVKMSFLDFDAFMKKTEIG